VEPTADAALIPPPEPPQRLRRTARRRCGFLAGSGLAYLGYPWAAWLGLLAAVAFVGGTVAFAVRFEPTSAWVALGGLAVGGALTLLEYLAVAVVPVRAGHGGDWVSRHFLAVCLAVYAAGVGALVPLVLLVRPWIVPTEAMAPALTQGAWLLRQRPLGPPEMAPGRLVVFRPPAEATGWRSGEQFLSRVLAGPGDQLAVNAGRYEVNGHSANAVSETGGREIVLVVPLAPETLTVPDGCWFVAPDNPDAAPDGRVLGWVRPGDVIATRFLRVVWPGGLKDVE
jgi:signal peptidase I